MSDVQHPKVLISAVDKSTTQLRLRFFNNVFNDEYSKRESLCKPNYSAGILRRGDSGIQVHVILCTFHKRVYFGNVANVHAV